MADRAWPPALRFSEAVFQIVGASRSGGQSIAGQEQVIVSPTGRWRASVTIPIADRRHGEDRDQVLAYRALVAGGRATTILVPVRDGRGPAHRAGIVPCNGLVRYGDGATFSDGSGFAQVYSSAVLAADATLNATQVAVTLGAGLQLLPGMRFSLPDGRLHEVGDITAFDGTVWAVTLAPWLRAAYPAGTALEFERAVCRMRPATDETGALSLRLNRLAAPTIEFVEAF